MHVLSRLVSSSLKLSGKTAKKLEKKVRRAEREKSEAQAAKSAVPAPAPVAAAAPAPAAAAAPAAPAAAKAPASSSKKKKATKSAAIDVDAMEVDDVMAGKPRLTELRRGRKSKAKAMSDE
jgi:hypothetical protein